MAIVVFLRGVNVGGHRTFRPSLFVRELQDYDVLNIGAAGTFVVWKPGPVTKFRAALLDRLGFTADVAICEGRDLIALMRDNPFPPAPPRPGIVRFVSVLTAAGGLRPSMPVAFPPQDQWFVRLLGYRGRFVCGEYRRHMKTIAYLGRIDKLFGAKVTTRNWNTIKAVVKILEDGRPQSR